jgi:hypothetical protein
MRPRLAMTVLISLAAAGAAHGQACTAFSDGTGGTSVTCPDGRSGYLRDLGGGVSAGLLGDQPFATPSTTLSNTPGFAYITPPPPAPPRIVPAEPPPPLIAPSIAPPSTSPPPLVPPQAINPSLAPLQQQYLQDQLARGRR